jgi:hypothetical protein
MIRRERLNDDADEPLRPGAALIGIMVYATRAAGFQYKNFAELARSRGAVVRYTDFGNGLLDAARSAYERAEFLLRHADALIIASDFPLASIHHYQSILHDRISAGVRVVFAGVTGTEEDRLATNQLLSRYYLELLPLKIAQGDEGNRYWVSFDEKQDCLSSHDLFAGVQSLQVSSPAVVKYSVEAKPLVYGSGEHWAINRLTDLRDPLLGRKISPMGIWLGSARGAVIADHSAGTLSDPIDVIAGHIPGIESNRTFAKNMIEFLVAAPTVQIKTATRDRLTRIECNLCDFVVGVLSLEDSNWLNLVPRKIVAKLSAKASDASSVKRFGNGISEIAFSDMWNFAEIIKENWPLFVKYFQDYQMSESDVRKKIEALNELRRLPGHPVLEYVTKYTYSEEEVEVVKEMDAMLLQLARPFFGSAARS